jgi:hypothetical protein
MQSRPLIPLLVLVYLSACDRAKDEAAAEGNPQAAP